MTGESKQLDWSKVVKNGDQGFLLALLIELDQLVGDVQDLRRTPKVVFQPDYGPVKRFNNKFARKGATMKSARKKAVVAIGLTVFTAAPLMRSWLKTLVCPFPAYGAIGVGVAGQAARFVFRL